MMHKYGDCSFCGGEVKADRVELDYRYKGKLYIFEDVPAGVCQQCGERYLTAEVAKEIEQRIQTEETLMTLRDTHEHENAARVP